ncbi:T9SS type A sorting domain-containing protein [Fibrella sp. WM1]|uniref:T9SS type A sorting domain-containing protein n=1 Tax=Fibrella musci TaxID=3242485 RepID=UPI0035203506
MKQIVLICAVAFSLLSAFRAVAQLSISFPTSRAVYQRNTANNAAISISGTYSTAISRIEARVIARAAGQGTSTDWQTIVNNPQGGVFSGQLTVQGGWYDLDVRLIRNDQQIAINRVERVGVGEVFVVAGQSNAQGFRDDGISAQDDRVSCVDYFYPASNYPADAPIPKFEHLDARRNISPRGIGSWCWGMLGDVLSRRLNVPVLFFNTAFFGTSVRNWAETATGDRTMSDFDPVFYETKHPYFPLRLTLQNYGSLLGIRAILWLQGETDNQFNTTSGQYVERLQTVIRQTRTDYGRNVAWMVARTSYDDRFGVDNNIISAQNQVIASGNNVYAGPNTDNIQIPRSRAPLYDVVHFDNAGLSEVAAAWSASMTDTFFANSDPSTGIPAPTVAVSCPGGNAVTYRVTNYSNVSWDSGENGTTVTKPTGSTIRAKVRDSQGNVTYTPAITISNAPTIQAVGETALCEGGSLTLSSSFGEANVWSNGQTTQRITVNTGGDYSVRYNDVSGCTFTSNTIRVNVNPLPARPTITADRSTTICQGESVALSSTSSNRYNWSNGQGDQRINVTQAGSYSLTVTDQNGCTSPASAAVVVTVNPVPSTPQLAASGRTTFCANESVTLTSTEGLAYVWSSGQNTRSINTNQSGTYTVRTRNEFNCNSAPSNAINVTAFPLPAQPTITNERPTTFCQGESTVLISSGAFRYNWSNGQGDQRITVSQSGSFSLTVTDQNGCTSPASAVVAVVANPLPTTPILTASSRTTFCANESITLTSTEDAGYNWSSGQNSRSINVNQTGIYSVRTRNQFNCVSAPSNSVNVLVNSLPAPPIISARGSLTFCEGGQLLLQTDSQLRALWSTGDSTQTLTVRETGAYTARVRDGNGCLSPNSNVLTARALARPQPPTLQQIGTYLLEASGAPQNERYFWRRNSDSLAVTGSLLRVNQSGQYSVRTQITYSPAYVCLSLPSTVVNYDLPTNNQDVSIYPNPSPDGIFLIETLADLSNASVTVYTLTGQLVYRSTETTLNDRRQLQLLRLAPGPYILKLDADGVHVSKRILIGNQ